MLPSRVGTVEAVAITNENVTEDDDVRWFLYYMKSRFQGKVTVQHLDERRAPGSAAISVAKSDSDTHVDTALVSTTTINHTEEVTKAKKGNQFEIGSPLFKVTQKLLTTHRFVIVSRLDMKKLRVEAFK